MHVVRSFVRVHGFQVARVPDHVVLVADSVGAEHVASRPSDGQRSTAVVSLDYGDLFGSGSGRGGAGRLDVLYSVL